MIIKSIKDKVAQFFFRNPASRLRVRQIEREVKVSLPSAIRAAKELESEGILISTDIVGVKTYSASRDDPEYLVQKKLFNLFEIHQSGLITYLREIRSNPTIVLFGSYARGEDVEESDIDLYLEAPNTKPIQLDKYEKILGHKIQVFMHKNIRDIKNKDLANNIINGITLNGFLEVFT